MLLGEHMYCVAVTFTMTEQAEQQICIKFCVKFEHSSVETIQLILKATAKGNWWFIMTTHPLMHHILCSFFDKTSDHPGDSAPLQPRFGTLWLLAFPKTKITFERREISDYWWDSGKYDRAADSNWENCVRSQGAYFEGDWGIIVSCTMFLVSSSKKCPYISYHMTGYLLDRPHTSWSICPRNAMCKFWSLPSECHDGWS